MRTQLCDISRCCELYDKFESLWGASNLEFYLLVKGIGRKSASVFHLRFFLPRCVP